MPAWSVPKIHLARRPRMRATRIRASWIDAVERVAHVQRAGHVRRRDGDRVVLVGVALRLRVEDARLLPAREHARLHLRGLVAGASSRVFRRSSGMGAQVCQPAAAAYYRALSISLIIYAMDASTLLRDSRLASGLDAGRARAAARQGAVDRRRRSSAGGEPERRDASGGTERARLPARPDGGARPQRRRRNADRSATCASRTPSAWRRSRPPTTRSRCCGGPCAAAKAG